MKRHLRLVVCGLWLCLLAFGAQGRPRDATIGSHGFFSSRSSKAEPTIEAVLLLTGEQEASIQATSDEFLRPVTRAMQREIARELGKIKQPTLDDQLRISKKAADKYAQRILEAFRTAKPRWKAVLTPEQNALIKKLDGVTQSVADDISAAYAERIAQAPDANARHALEQQRDDVISATATIKLRDALTAEQSEALRATKATD